jgi:two-component system, LytTR family, sensor histidine kinase AlgZ
MEAAAMAKWATVASINQTGAGIRLPNFCNLGVMLRSLLVANLFVLAGAVAHASSVATIPIEIGAMAAFAEPVIMASLVVLCALRPVLHRLTYAASLVLLALVEAGIASTVHALAAQLMPGPSSISMPQVALLAVFITGCVVAYFDLRARALSPAVAEARIQALQARIRPHFLYNSINAVLGLIRTEPRRAERALEDLADLFRVLMADNRTLAPIAGEVELVRQYLAIEEIRLGDRLRVAWNTAGMPPDALVPPMLLQPLVENAVYHGIEPSTEGGEIAIDVGRKGDELVMQLTNPVPAASRQTHGNRMALANIRERLQLHFDAEASMKSEVLDGHYRVTIRLPYLTARS